jgi:hypothetical protein
MTKMGICITDAISISKQTIKQRYYEIMEEVFSEYKDIDENEIERVGTIVIRELETRIIADSIINLYDDELVKEELKKWKEQTLEKMKVGIKYAKKDYDEKYNGIIKSMENILLVYIENIWKDISNVIYDLYLTFDDIYEGNIGKIRNKLRNFAFYYKRYNFVKYECNEENIIDIPCAWLRYAKGTKGTKGTNSKDIFMNDMEKEKEDIIKRYREEYKKYYNQFIETRKENLAIYLSEPIYTCKNVEETRKMVEMIRNKGYNVYFLDILPTIQYIEKINANINEKYEFIESKIKLYEIQTKDDFEKKYSEKIVNLYYSLNNYKNNDKIADIIKHKIIDKLFFYLV